MSNPYPKYTSSQAKGNKGVTLITQIIEDDFDWIFRGTPQEKDFGIDGYMDIVNDDSFVTGKSIALQVKTGASYFKNITSNGWEFHGDNKHLNYYLNHTSPILITIVNLETKEAFWALFDSDKISKSKTGWTLNISSSNRLEKKHKQYLQSLPGYEVDYLSQLEYQWSVDQEMKESGIIMIGIDKSDIENLDISGFTTLLKRLTSSDDMIKKTIGKLSFVLFGYEDDSREVYQIDEIRKWVQVVIPAFKYWGNFLSFDEPYVNVSGLTILHLCSVKINIVGPSKENNGNLVEPDKEETLELMHKLWGWMNEFTDTYKLPEEINKENSYKISKILTGI